MLEKSIKQLNRVSIWVSFRLGLGLDLGSGLVKGLALAKLTKAECCIGTH